MFLDENESKPVKMDATPCYLQSSRRHDGIREANGLLANLSGPSRGQRNMDMPDTVGAVGRENAFRNRTVNWVRLM